ncbi:MAG: phosphoadenylyl-sulfate reductase [Nitrososphaerales archaeon]
MISLKGELKEINRLAEEFEREKAEKVLEWALKEFHPRIAFASSFGAEDVVIIDMLYKINPEARVFTLDTGRLPQETYDVMDKIREIYKIKIDVYFPNNAEVERMVREHGLNLFYKSVELRKLCCEVRKVEPLKRALSNLDAWITGIRREQLYTRAKVKKIEVDFVHNGIVKVNPLADWSWEDVWKYITANKVPYNKLHDKGYPSIGCLPCTRAIKEGEDFRAGRWWWEREAHKECGLHYSFNT